VSGFSPPGYVPTPEAVRMAMECWFADRAAALGDRLTALWRPYAELADLLAMLEADAQAEFADIVRETEDRLRHHLCEGKRIKACFFGDALWEGRQEVKPDFWATEAAHEVLLLGRYFPLGQGRGPSYPLFLLEAGLTALLSDQQKKVPLPERKIAELAAALRPDLPRKAARAAVSKLPEFEKFRITDENFRRAEKASPRKAGRKRKR